MIERAFAKVNLDLEVVSKRPDGYHSIISLMATVDIFDLLKLELISVREDLNVNVTFSSIGGDFSDVLLGIRSEDNLITKAARAYSNCAGIGMDVVFSVEKNIPSGAGLGGGSSDAAAVLRLLNRHFKRFTDQELCDIGGKIGADVPFCVKGGIALCEGIGDLITDLVMKIDYRVLVANNGEHVDTREAYGYIDKIKDYSGVKNNYVLSRKLEITGMIKNGFFPSLLPGFFNDFESPVFKAKPSVLELKKAMVSAGCDFAIMTGSGSSVIGLFSNEEKLSSAYELMKGKVKWLKKASFT